MCTVHIAPESAWPSLIQQLPMSFVRGELNKKPIHRIEAFELMLEYCSLLLSIAVFIALCTALSEFSVQIDAFAYLEKFRPRWTRAAPHTNFGTIRKGRFLIWNLSLTIQSSTLPQRSDDVLLRLHSSGSVLACRKTVLLPKFSDCFRLFRSNLLTIICANKR